MINDRCSVCLYGPELLDWTLSKTEIARQVGCHRESVSRHIKHSEDPELRVTRSGPPEGAHEPAGEWIPRRRWETPQGEVLNSFQFVPAGENIPDVDEARIDSLIRDWPFTPLGVPMGATEFAFPADLQLGKAGEAGGGTAETIGRFTSSIERVAQRWSRAAPEHAYLCDLGDLVENIYSTPSQVSTNDRTLPEQIEDAVALYMNALGRLRPLVGTLHFATVTSNHGEARSAPKVNPYGSENDWGLHIFRAIKGKCEDRGWDIEFHRPDTNEDTCVLEIPDGTKVALNHGHHSSSPARIKEWWKNQVVGRRPGWDASCLVAGHYHHRYLLSFGDNRTIFGTPALDGGSAWFTKKSGEESKPGILCLTMADGDWSNYSIL